MEKTTVVCINDKNSDGNLTVGRTYVVIGKYWHNYYILEKDNRQNKNEKWCANRFILEADM